MYYLQISWLGLLMGSVLAIPAQAELHGRWPLTPGGTDYQAAYDDVLDITWMTDARLSSIRDWKSMVIWADSLSLLGVDDWRLASLSVSAGLPTGTAASVVDCETATEQACRDNELGYMYYYNLPPGSGIKGDDKTGTQTVGDVTLTNIAENIFSGTEGTEIGEVWAFDFDGGTNDIHGKGSTFPGWAVRDGDIGLIDPTPPVNTCDGVKIQGETFDSLTFNGESCLLLDVTVNGDLTVINADTFTIQESEVSGNITVQSSRDVSIFDVRANTVLAEDNVYFNAYAMIVEEMQVDRNETAAVSGISATYLDCQDNVNLYSTSNGSSSGNNCRADSDPPPDPEPEPEPPPPEDSDGWGFVRKQFACPQNNVILRPAGSRFDINDIEISTNKDQAVTLKFNPPNRVLLKLFMKAKKHFATNFTGQVESENEQALLLDCTGTTNTTLTITITGNGNL